MQNSGNIGGSFSLAQWISANKLKVGIGVTVAAVGAFGLYMYVTKTTPIPKVVSGAEAQVHSALAASKAKTSTVSVKNNTVVKNAVVEASDAASFKLPSYVKSIPR